MSVTMQSLRRSGGERDGAAPRILLAEDDAEMRSLVGSALRLDGYDVVEASDGGRMLVQLASAYGGGEPRATYDLLDHGHSHAGLLGLARSSRACASRTGRPRPS